MHGIECIDKFFVRYQKAAWEMDITGMINLYEEDVMIFDMWGKGFISGLTEWGAVIKDWLGSLNDERVKVGFEQIERQEGDMVAYASAWIGFQAVAPDEKLLRSMKNRITVGLVKRDGHWKVKHQHTSAPIDMEWKAILNI